MPEQPRNVALAVAAAQDGRPYYAIAAAAGVNASDFSGFLSGRKRPSPRARRGIARALGREEDDLFGEAARSLREHYAAQADSAAS